MHGCASEQGSAVIEILVRRWISGTLPIARRPEGGRLIRELRSGDVVIAAKLDRMFRSAVDALSTIKELQKRGEIGRAHV